MKEMIYQKDRKIELLHNDIYKNYHYYILNLGTHPTAYVEIPKKSNLYGKNYNDIDIMCHYGLTYGRSELYTSENTKLDNSWFIGWDYAHCDDYCGYEESMPEFLQTKGKKWTTQEIIEECKNVIEQIINLESQV